ncbi:MAG: Flp pilus assembly protein CpaB [Burkholderiales bacterium]|nr:Flp pilus assembly protein CpaB [Burkholderiales bacterium]
MSAARFIPRPGKSALLLIGAVLFGLVAAFATRGYIQKSIDTEASKYRKKAELVEVVVANQNLPKGSVVSEDTMALRKVPKEAVASSMVTPDQFAKIAGNHIQADMKAGDPLVLPLLERWDASSFSERLKQGIRAITIPVDDTNSVAGMVHPGDLIDIYLSAKPVDMTGAGKVTSIDQTFLLLQAMQVLATGQKLKVDKTVTVDNGLPDQATYSSLTLSVTPDQAQKIMVAQKAGNFHVVLRNPKDDAQIKSQPQDAGSLFGSTAKIEHVGALAEVIVGGGRGISHEWQSVAATPPGQPLQFKIDMQTPGGRPSTGQPPTLSAITAPNPIALPSPADASRANR